MRKTAVTALDSTIHSIPLHATDAVAVSSRRTMLALGLILLAAAGLRFGGLDREGRWGDEYFQTMQYDMSPYYVVLGARTNNQPPLDYLIGWAVTKISRTTWMMRAPAAVFGVAGVAMLFVLARRWFGTGAALLAAALLAVAPLHWKLSQEARPYTIFVVLMLLTFWLLVRAMERPTVARVAAYALAAWLMTLARGLAPLVVVLCVGAVLTVAWIAGAADRQAVRRVWVATLVVGLLALPMLLFLLNGDSGWTVFASPNAEPGASALPRVFAAIGRNAWIWMQAPAALFGRGALPIMVLALLGVVGCAARWRTWPLSTQCVLATMWLSGPVYLLVYSATVAQLSICDRYAMFLTPMLIVFAAHAVVSALRWTTARPGSAPRYIAIAGAMMLVLLPASSTLGLTGKFFRPDWRGTAGYLGARYGADDVIMVFADRPLGAGQAPYWGKLDWPVADRRPLGESMWTLATSEAHWRRLISRSGNCCVVLKYFVGAQEREDYRTLGVIDAPNGTQLTKFRGLDVLEGFAGDDPASRLIAACDSVVGLPKAHAESRAIAYLLRSRVELHAGRSSAARASYRQAVESVPPQRQAWFHSITAQHRQALADQSEPRP